MMGFYEIARHLNRLGYKTKKGGAFETRTIRYIIQNPIYKGYLRWNYANGTTRVVNDESEWIIVKSPLVPIIVSEELWDRANERLKNEYRPKNGKPVSKHRHWLSGLVKVFFLRRFFSTSVQYRHDRTYINFQCYKYLKGKCLVSHGISEKKLVPLVLNVLKEDMSKSYIECERIEKVVENQQDILDVQLKRLATREARIKEAYLNGIDSLAEYKANKEEIQKKREFLLQQSQDHNKTEKESNELPNKIRGVYDILVFSLFLFTLYALAEWMTQWGSKYLGDQGYAPIEILRYYYGESMYINTAEQISGIPSSWPGYDLTISSRGDKVRQIQQQLNRIAKDYPSLPTIAVDGVYGESTANAVRKFQNIFGLPQTGIVDYPTWYKISEIYVGVSRIAELN